MTARKSEILGVQKWQWLVVAFALVALVVFMNLSGERSPYPQAADDEVERLLEQGTSDELTAIEQDLSRTNLTDLDRELTDIGVEFR